MASKKPDNVVYDQDSKTYDAALKPYATHVGAPAIQMENLAPWKNKGVHQVNASLAAEFQEIKNKFQNLQERFRYNDLVYSAKFNFQPIVGNTYHLYHDKMGEPFLSILAPQECNFDHMGTFRLQSDYMWIRTDVS